MVIVVAIIIASVLATRDDSPDPAPAPSEKATSAPTALDNNICEEAHPITLGGSAISSSLDNASEQLVVFCEDPDRSDVFQPGLWYKVRGVRAVFVAGL